MLHVCTETVMVNISKLVKGQHEGEHAKACSITPEMLASIEEVVKAMLEDETLVVEVEHVHDDGEA